MNMGRRRASRRESDASDASDASEQEEGRSSDEEESGSSEDGSVSGDSDSHGSGDEESGEDEDEEEDKDGDADKLARVARDVEQMRAMCAEMDKMKRRLQFRLDAAREVRLDALRREAEAREQTERRQAAAADIDAPQVPAAATNDLHAGEITPPPPVPVLMADAGVQTDCDMVTMDRMEASLRASSNSAETTALVSLPTSNTVRMESAVSDGAQVLPASVDDRSPGLSINDLDKSGGAAGGRSRNDASAFYDHVLTGFSRSKKMDTIPSVSSDSDRSATPDQPSWPSISHHSVEDRVVSNETLRTANSSFGNRPPTAEGASHYSHQAESTRGSYQAADERSARSSGVIFDAQDSLRAPLSPVSTASADKTDEQRELEAIQSLLFGR
jgi:hypothetical protein